MKALDSTGDLKSAGFVDAKAEARIATWNVRTLYQAGKLQQLCKEFKQYNLKALGVCETHWTGSGKIEVGGLTFIYSGNEKLHRQGVGILMAKKMSASLMSWNPVSERIIFARFKTRHTKVTWIQAYAPTKDADDEIKDKFYNELQGMIQSIPRHDMVLLLGDLNAQIAARRDGMEHTIGPWGSAQETRDNGERLLLTCSTNSLCIANTYFRQADTQEDMEIARREHIQRN